MTEKSKIERVLDAGAQGEPTSGSPPTKTPDYSGLYEPNPLLVGLPVTTAKPRTSAQRSMNAHHESARNPRADVPGMTTGVHRRRSTSMTTNTETTAAKPAKTRAAPDPELRAIAQVEKALDGLSSESRTRVLRYVNERTPPTYRPSPNYITPLPLPEDQALRAKGLAYEEYLNKKFAPVAEGTMVPR